MKELFLNDYIQLILIPPALFKKEFNIIVTKEKNVTRVL